MADDEVLTKSCYQYALDEKKTIKFVVVPFGFKRFDSYAPKHQKFVYNTIVEASDKIKSLGEYKSEYCICYQESGETQHCITYTNSDHDYSDCKYVNKWLKGLAYNYYVDCKLEKDKDYWVINDYFTMSSDVDVESEISDRLMNLGIDPTKCGSIETNIYDTLEIVYIFNYEELILYYKHGVIPKYADQLLFDLPEYFDASDDASEYADIIPFKNMYTCTDDDSGYSADSCDQYDDRSHGDSEY